MAGRQDLRGEPPKGEQRAWKVTAMLVQGDDILTVAGPLEFSTNWLKNTAKLHGLCNHPVTLECQLVRAWREAAQRAGVVAKSGLQAARGLGER